MKRIGGQKENGTSGHKAVRSAPKAIIYNLMEWKSCRLLEAATAKDGGRLLLTNQYMPSRGWEDKICNLRCTEHQPALLRPTSISSTILPKHRGMMPKAISVLPTRGIPRVIEAITTRAICRIITNTTVSLIRITITPIIRTITITPKTKTPPIRCRRALWLRGWQIHNCLKTLEELEGNIAWRRHIDRIKATKQTSGKETKDRGHNDLAPSECPLRSDRKDSSSSRNREGSVWLHRRRR